jgi:hypothetical protein
MRRIGEVAAATGLTGDAPGRGRLGGADRGGRGAPRLGRGADRPARALADRWAALVGQFTGGDPGIHASLNTMYANEGADRASRGAVSPELFAWMGEAMAAR